MRKTRIKVKKKRMSTMNKVLLILGLFIMAFIITMVVIFCVKGSTPDTLITYTLGAGGLEALFLAAIKISKVVAGGKNKKTEGETDENFVE
jgi:hypothetical protein